MCREENKKKIKKEIVCRRCGVLSYGASAHTSYTVAVGQAARKIFSRSKRPVIAYVINNASNWKTYIIPVLIYNVSVVGRIPPYR